MQKKIVNKESFSSGKKQGKNDDDIYIGEDFAAVIDGVSHKSSVLVDGKKVRIAEIITEAIRKMYIKSSEIREEVEAYRRQRIKSALLECGFTEEEIEQDDLIRKYYNPRDLQKILKNNPNMGTFGYAVFNGKNTETKNCKVVYLPNNVKTIKMFSDGFPIDVLNNDKGIGHAVRIIRKRAKTDPLSISNNPATHVAVRYSKKTNRVEEMAIDDASAVIIEIIRDEREIDER